MITLGVMLERAEIRVTVSEALRRSPVVLLVGARQVGKTTLARTFVRPESENYFDLEDPVDLARLDEPMTALSNLTGIVVIDEVQRRPDLFPVLRVLADRTRSNATFLVLGSASPGALRQSSESLAGRVDVIELPGIGIAESQTSPDTLWRRGGYPRSLLAATEADSQRWRQQYVRALANRDLADFGMSMPAATIERFLGLVAHHHGNLWNAASTARAIGISEPTARRYIDALADALLVRILTPWHSSQGKRLVRTPKVYFRDTGLVHTLLGITDQTSLLRHPQVGASWESLAIDEILRRADGSREYFWRTSNGAELDLLVETGSRLLGFEVKRADAPTMTKSIRSALDDLAPDHVWIVYPGTRRYSIRDSVETLPINDLVGVTSLDEL
jgi:uncharacterized protein